MACVWRTRSPRASSPGARPAHPAAGSSAAAVWYSGHAGQVDPPIGTRHHYSASLHQPDPTLPSQALGSPFTPSPEFQSAEAEERSVQGDVSSIAPSQSLSQAIRKQRLGRRAGRQRRAPSKELSGVDPDRRLTQENLEAVQDVKQVSRTMHAGHSQAGRGQYGAWEDQPGSRLGGEMDGYIEDADDYSPDTVQHGEAHEYPLPPIPASTAGGRGRSFRSQGQALGSHLAASQAGGGGRNWASHRSDIDAREHQAYPQDLMLGYGQQQADHHRTGTIRTRSNLGWESPPVSDDNPATELQSAVERMTVGGTTVLGGRSAVTGMTGIGGMP